MLYAGLWPSVGRCMPRILLAWDSRLVVRSVRLCSVSVGHDIQRCVCVIPCLRTYADMLRASVSQVVGSVVLVAGASTVQCIPVLSASQCARAWFVWWAECLKRSPSASVVAVPGSGVHVWPLVAVPFPSHCATHRLCW